MGHQLKGFYYYIQGNLTQAFEEIDQSEELAKQVNDNGLIDVAYREKIWICYEWGKIDLFRDYQKARMGFRASNSLGDEFENSIISHFYEGLADLKTGHIEAAKSKLSVIHSMLFESEKETEQTKQLKTSIHDYFKSLILLEDESPDEAIALIEAMPPPKVSFNAVVSFIRRNLPFDDDLFALAFLKKGEVDKAIAEYERITALNLEIGLDRPLIHPLSRYRLAKLYEEKGQREKAIEQYEKALEMWKNADEGLVEMTDTRKSLKSLKADSSKK
jgi:tetratricopeptide (TPR) repeat protein